MENMDAFERDLSGPSAQGRKALQERLAADGGWFGLFSKMRGGNPVEVHGMLDEYTMLVNGATSEAERTANGEAIQRHRATTGEGPEGVVDRNFMELAAGGIKPEDISGLLFSVGVHLVAHPGQPIRLPGQE